MGRKREEGERWEYSSMERRLDGGGVSARNCQISNSVLCLSSGTGSEKVILPISSILHLFFYLSLYFHQILWDTILSKTWDTSVQFHLLNAWTFLTTRGRKSACFPVFVCVIRCRQIEVYSSSLSAHQRYIKTSWWLKTEMCVHCSTGLLPSSSQPAVATFRSLRCWWERVQRSRPMTR